MHYFLFILLFPLLLGCDNKPKRVAKGEMIYRKSNHFVFIPPKPLPLKQKTYPWEEKYKSANPKITKEFFLCKGNVSNPAVVKTREGKEPIYFRDCSGGDRHGLPLREGKEFIYPCLIEILNYIQDKTGKRVVITSGHRCPDHNAYCDFSPKNYGSKHMMGAEVDFYVEGLENNPKQLLSLIQSYYKEHPIYHTDEFLKFERYEKEDSNVKIPPWYNKEIFIKLYSSTEGRDYDNQHPYPYLCLQVRFDRDKNEKVRFDDKLIRNYLRH